MTGPVDDGVEQEPGLPGGTPPGPPPPVVQSGGSRRLPWIAVVLVATLAVALFAWQARRFWPITVDDAAISFTYARNLADGHGLVLNPGGERVEAFSNPAWVGLLAGLHALGGPVPLGAKLLGVILALGALALALLTSWSAGRGVTGGTAQPQRARLLLAGALAGLGAAACTAWPLWAVAGLETALHALLLLLCLHLLAGEHRRPDRWPWSALALLALAWTRPEAPLYIAAAACFKALGAVGGSQRSVRARVRSLLAWGAPLVGGVLLSVGARWMYFDDLLPNSYWIKRITFAFDRPSVLDFSNRGWAYVGAFFHGQGLWPLLLLLPWGLTQRKLRAAAMAGLLLLGAGLAFPIYAQGDWMPESRFVAPLVPLLFLLAAWGLAALVELVLQRVPAGRRTLAAALLLPCAWLPFAGLSVARTREGLARVQADRFTRMEPVAERGRYFATAAAQLRSRHARLLDPDLGGTAWASGLEVLDLFGLADRMLPRYRWDAPLVREYFLSELRPEFIHLHGAWFSAYFLHEYPEISEGYVRLPARLGGRSVEGFNLVRRSSLADPWAPALPGVRFPDVGLRVRTLRPGADVALPGAGLPFELELIAEARLPAGLALELSLTPHPQTSVLVDGLGRLSADWLGYEGSAPTLALSGVCPPDPGGRLVLRSALGGRPLGGALSPVRQPSAAPPAPGSECRWLIPVPVAARAEAFELAWQGDGRPGERWVELRVPAPLGSELLSLDEGWLPARELAPGEAATRAGRLAVGAGVTVARARLLLAARTRSGWLPAEGGLLPVALSAPRVGAAAAAEGYEELLDGLAGALLAARLDRSLRALADLERYDDGRDHPGVAASRRRVLAEVHTRVLTLAEVGDLETAAALWTAARDASRGAEQHAVLGRELAAVLLAQARQGATLRDAEGAFGLAREALRCDPALASARTLMEEWRGRRTSAHAPFAEREARRAGLAYGRAPTAAGLVELVRALSAAGLDTPLARLGSEDGRLRELDARDRTLVAGALRRQGLLNAALAVLPSEGSPADLAAGLLRQDTRSLLGLEPRPGETRALLELLPVSPDRPLQHALSLAGWEWSLDRDERLVVRLYLRRTSRAVAGRRLHACLSADGEAGRREQCRTVFLPGGRVATVELPLRVAGGRHTLAARVSPAGRPVTLGAVTLALPNHTFEASSFEGWQVAGAAFGAGAAPGQPEPGQGMITGYRGRSLVNSYRHGDAAEGTLRSAPFPLVAPRLGVLVGGGRGPGVGVRLLVAGETVREASGANTERLTRHEWDVSEWRGQPAVVEVYDHARGGWGHILVDDLQPLPARTVLPGEGTPGGGGASQ